MQILDIRQNLIFLTIHMYQVPNKTAEEVLARLYQEPQDIGYCPWTLNY